MPLICQLFLAGWRCAYVPSSFFSNQLHDERCLVYPLSLFASSCRLDGCLCMYAPLPFSLSYLPDCGMCEWLCIPLFACSYWLDGCLCLCVPLPLSCFFLLAGLWRVCMSCSSPWLLPFISWIVACVYAVLFPLAAFSYWLDDCLCLCAPLPLGCFLLLAELWRVCMPCSSL